MTTDDKRSTDEIGITTGARLHFGLLDTAAPFGGLGVMIADPQTQIRITAASQFECSGDGADRAIEIANRLTEFLKLGDPPACSVEILRRPQAHIGLGSGTQLAMAVADGLAQFCAAKIPPQVLAQQIANRGKRSAIGVHGYLQGGLIFETGQPDAADQLNPIIQRLELPADWTVLLARPKHQSETVFGTDEQQQFERLDAATEKQRAALKHIITDQVIPAVKAGDFLSFAAAVHHYNHQSGMLFSSVQGGPYNGPQVTSTIELLQQHGAQGVGQSSWGPSVFSWFPNRSDAEEFASSLPRESLVVNLVGIQNCPASKTHG